MKLMCQLNGEKILKMLFQFCCNSTDLESSVVLPQYFLYLNVDVTIDEQLNENNNSFLGKVKEIGDLEFTLYMNITNITIEF